MIFGQIINLLPSLTLPWSFILLKGGMTGIGETSNVTCYIFIFFACTAFPLLYLFGLLWRRQSELLKKARTASQKNKLRRVKSAVPRRINLLNLKETSKKKLASE